MDGRMWSRKHACCTQCGTTEKKHYGQGRCRTCYQRAWAVENHDQIVISQRAWYEKEKAMGTDFAERSRKNRNGPVAEAMRRAGEKCERCPSTEHLHVHHKDHKGSNVPKAMRNNSLENLEVLCRRCHGEEHGNVEGWSRRHPSCVRCGSTEKKHASNGHCTSCVHRHYHPAKTAWARYSGHTCCVVCGKTDRPHRGRGMCTLCHDRQRSR